MSELTEWWIRPRTTLRKSDVIDVPYGDLRNLFLDQGYVWVVNKGAYDAMKADRDRLRAALERIVNAVQASHKEMKFDNPSAWSFIDSVSREALEKSKEGDG